MKITDNTKLSTTQKKTNTKHSKTKLPWFSRLLRHSASKRGGAYFTMLQSPHGLSGKKVFWI